MFEEAAILDEPRVRRWLPWRVPAPRAVGRLFCFPFAGGSAATYRRWAARLPGIEVCPVELPGRATRLREPLVSDMSELTEQLAELVAVFDDLPFGFFGHSMGALIAFDLAKRLGDAGRSGPSWLIASAARSPDRIRASDAKRRTDAELIEGLRRLDGTPPEILDNAELLARSLPVLRADYGLVESRRPPSSQPLSCDLLTVAGRSDTLAPPEGMADWARFTHGHHADLVLPGGHFFIHEASDLLFSAVANLMAHRSDSPLYGA